VSESVGYTPMVEILVASEYIASRCHLHQNSNYSCIPLYLLSFWYLFL